MQHELTRRIRTYESQVAQLLAAPSISYAHWPPKDVTDLRLSAGVYHFYETCNGVTASLYVGKAGFGAGNWSLFARLKQHFQPSQRHTMLGNAAKALGKNPDEIKAEFLARSVCLQWLPMFTKPGQPPPTLERNLIWLECYAKALLQPMHTDA